MLPKIPPDMLHDLRRVVRSEYIGGAAPTDYKQYIRFKKLQRRKLIKYYDRKRARWDQTFYLATGLGHRAAQDDLNETLAAGAERFLDRMAGS